MNIVMLGAPGSGKGTHGKRLSQYFSIPHISTGDLLRTETTKKTELGDTINSLISSGNLVPDEMITDLLVKRLSESDVFAGFVLDGYPRTFEQAKTLSSFLPSVKAVLLEIKDNILHERISARRNHSIEAGLKPRDDDTSEILTKRLEIFNNETGPIIEYYNQSSSLISICSEGHVEDVFRNILSHLQK